MITLRALVGSSFVLAVMVLVCILPLSWGLVLSIAAISSGKIIRSQPYQQNVTHEGIKHKIAEKQK